jgi:hypothetical protein
MTRLLQLTPIRSLALIWEDGTLPAPAQGKLGVVKPFARDYFAKVRKIIPRHTKHQTVFLAIAPISGVQKHSGWRSGG